MTQTSPTPQPPASAPAPVEPEPTPFLTLRTALVLLAAAFIGLISGGLTFLSGGPAAGAVLAGLTAFGVSVPVLHQLIR